MGMCTSVFNLPIFFHINIEALLLRLRLRHLLCLHLCMSAIGGFILTLRLCFEGDIVVSNLWLFTIAWSIVDLRGSVARGRLGGRRGRGRRDDIVV